MDKAKAIIISVFSGLFCASRAAAVNFTGFSAPSGSSAGEYALSVVNFGIAMGGVVATVIIIMAGIGLVTSQGEPSKISEAKDKIKNAFFGLLILLSCYLILNVINPQLTKITISSPTATVSEPETLEDAGAHLYDDTQFSTSGKQLVLTRPAATLTDNDFGGSAKSVRFVNPDLYKYGAVLYSDTDMRGYCSIITSDLSDAGTASGTQNNPPVGTIKSMSVFKRDTENTASVTIYNTVNCTERSNDFCLLGDPDYGCQSEDNKRCVINSSTKLENIKDICPDFMGDVLSFNLSPAKGVLLKSADKDAEGKCQYFSVSKAACINVVKDSYVYTPLPYSSNKPYSIMVISLYK